MIEKPQRKLMYSRPDGNVIGANYDADAMDEWLSAEVARLFRHMMTENLKVVFEPDDVDRVIQDAPDGSVLGRARDICKQLEAGCD